MSTLREYSWNDWMSNPKNKELYNKDSKEGLRQFQLEKQRRYGFFQKYNNKNRRYK